MATSRKSRAMRPSPVISKAEACESVSGTLQIADTVALVNLLRAGVDANALIALQLANRGLDLDGRWVGFASAAEIFAAAYPSAAADAAVNP